MNVHKNARLTRHGRERIVKQIESGQTPQAVAEAAGVRCSRAQQACGYLGTLPSPYTQTVRSGAATQACSWCCG